MEIVGADIKELGLQALVGRGAADRGLKGSASQKCDAEKWDAYCESTALHGFDVCYAKPPSNKVYRCVDVEGEKAGRRFRAACTK